MDGELVFGGLILMPELRDRPFMVYIEETFYEILESLATRNGQSLSGYARGLVLRDLLDHDLINEEVLLRVTTGSRRIP